MCFHAKKNIGEQKKMPLHQQNFLLSLQDGIYRVFPGAASAVSTPPTPFADRESLEAELKALEKDLGDIQQLKMLNGWHTPTSSKVPSHISDGELRKIQFARLKDN